MELSFSDEDLAFRDEARAWLAQNVPQGRPAAEGPAAREDALTWLRRDGGHSLADRALAARKHAPGHYLWFACEKAEVQRLRAALQQDKPAPGTSYIAAYWSQS